MLSCKQITQQASEYLDGELSVWRRLQYRLHLLACHNCRRFLANFKAGIAMLRRCRHSQPHEAEIAQLCDQLARQLRD